MRHEEIIMLGWGLIDEWGKPSAGMNQYTIVESGGSWLLGICLTPDEDGFYSTFIKWVDADVKVNVWENSETNFYGNIKLASELGLVMQLIEASEYKGML